MPKSRRHTTARVTTAISAVLALALCASPASAHQPVRLTAGDRTPSSGPLLVDGTVSFAVYATVREGVTRGFRVGMRQGQRLEIQLLITDRAPVNRLSRDELPLVSVIEPGGRRITLTIDERTPFYEPYSGTAFLYLARETQVAREGTYRVIVTGRSSIKVPAVIGVGYREVQGTVRD